MLKLIIFDLDGTLLDTSRDIHKILNESLAHFYLPQVSLQDTVKMVGNGAKRLVEDAVPQEHKAIVNSVYEFYSTFFVENDNALTELYPGEREVLLKLKALNVKFAIITNKPDAATQKVCFQFLSGIGFDLIIGGGAGFPLKPDAKAAIYAMEKFNVSCKEALFVGDGETDIKTAQAAGIECISALWGFRTKEQLLSAGGKLFAEDYTQFLQILQEKFL